MLALCVPALVLALVPASARAQVPQPSLLVVAVTLRQAGDELEFGLRFNRAVPVRELQPGRGRMVCVVLSPQRPARRRVCVSRRDGRLRATLAGIDELGFATGPSRPVRGARVVVRGTSLSLRVAAGAVRVRLGDAVAWHAYVQWQDGSGCAAVPDPAACTQTVPPAAPLRFRTRAARRPAFTRLHRLRVLATGDSMIQIVDGHLARRLRHRRGASVRSDAHIGTGISRPDQLDWVRRARAQSAGFKPDVTVVFLGANDGFPLAGVPCCGAGWGAAYARRVEAMMRSYLRGGRSYVYWLTLPAPDRAAFVPIYSRVNSAIEQAARRVGGGVRVIDTARVFTPGGSFRQTITFRGRTINARQPDGIHLSTAGAAVAATLVIDRLRADHALP